MIFHNIHASAQVVACVLSHHRTSVVSILHNIMSRERLGTHKHSQQATSRLVFHFYEYTKKDKRTGSNDCVQTSLTQCESMLMALCSLHSIGNAPGGIHQRIPHTSTSIAHQRHKKNSSRPMNSSARSVLAPTPHARHNYVREDRTEGWYGMRMQEWRDKITRKRSFDCPQRKLRLSSHSTDSLNSEKCRMKHSFTNNDLACITSNIMFHSCAVLATYSGARKLHIGVDLPSL